MIYYPDVKDVVNVGLRKRISDGKPAISIRAYNESNDLITLQTNLLTNGFAIHYCNNFLKELAEHLGLDVDVKFETYSQYGELMWEINDALTERREYCNICEA